jgi:hypothetical protein
MSSGQIGALSAAGFSGLTTTAVGALSSVQTAALTATQAAGLSTAIIAGLTTSQVASLSTSAVAALTATQAKALTLLETAAFTSAQVNALTAADLGAFSAAQIQTLNVSGLSTAKAAGLSTSVVGSLTAVQVASMSTTALAGFTAAQTAVFTVADLNGLSASQMQALKLSALSTATLKGLTASAIGNMTGAEFASAMGTNLALLTTAQVKAITASEIGALSATQVAAFTTAQQAAMTATASAALVNARIAALGGGAVLSDFQAQEKNGAIGYNGLLKVLQDAATGGMTRGEYAALGWIADDLNVAGGVSTSAYVQQIFDDVVLGNSANATWTGGAAKSVALGNLSATSSQTQVQKLIGKWFLGTDLPSDGGLFTGLPTAWVKKTMALFDSSGSPKVTDVNQGSTGDCYFLATLAGMAEQEPSSIKNMIHDNGNGTYSVEFHVNGQPDYVTVDSEIDSLTGGYTLWSGQTAVFDNGNGTMWSSLIEKAFVQLNEQTSAMHWEDGKVANSYADIAGGWMTCIGELTGQNVGWYGMSSNDTAAYDTNILKTLQTALAQGQVVDMATSTQKISYTTNLVANHMFSVQAVDAAAGTVTLYNPWGNAAGSGSVMAMFTKSVADLAADNVMFQATSGHSLMG